MGLTGKGALSRILKGDVGFKWKGALARIQKGWMWDSQRRDIVADPKGADAGLTWKGALSRIQKKELEPLNDSLWENNSSLPWKLFQKCLIV